MSSGYPPLESHAYNPEASAPPKAGGSKTKWIVIGAIVVVAVIVAIILGVTLSNNGDSDGTKSASEPTPQPTVEEFIQVKIQSANTKEKWMETMVANFEADSTVNTYNGKTINITLVNTGSTFKPELQPNIWSPANAQFIRLQETADNTEYVSDESTYCKSTTSIPVGVAMWYKQAQALGWDTDSRISFRELADLALDPLGWDSLGPWGTFKYGHGHPDVSNSGRLSVVANIFALSNASIDGGGLSADDVATALEDEEVIALEQAVYHLGKIDTDILARMLQHGPTYLHAVANYESNVINWNLDYAQELAVWDDKWAFIYLKDGTFWMTHPLCVLDQSSWTSDEQIQAALQFIEYTQSTENFELLLQYGIRPPSYSGITDITCCDSTITKANGADPEQSYESVLEIPYPSDAVMQQVIDGWHLIKKPAAFALVIDDSGSMRTFDTDEDGNLYTKTRMTFAKEAVTHFVNATDPQDYIQARSFQSVFSSPGRVSNITDAAFSWIDALSQGGGTPLFATTAAAFDALQALKNVNDANGIDWNYAVVAMTDGVPNTDDVTLYETLCEKFANEAGVSTTYCPLSFDIEDSEFAIADPNIIHFFPIVFGSEAEAALEQLERIANISAGKAFTADAADLDDVYFQISLEL